MYFLNFSFAKNNLRAWFRSVKFKSHTIMFPYENNIEILQINCNDHCYYNLHIQIELLKIFVKQFEIFFVQVGPNGVEIQEVFDSDDEDEDEGVMSDGKVGKIRRHFIHHNNQVKSDS